MKRHLTRASYPADLDSVQADCTQTSLSQTLPCSGGSGMETDSVHVTAVDGYSFSVVSGSLDGEVTWLSRHNRTRLGNVTLWTDADFDSLAKGVQKTE
jgi:hypothetical protein